jgi:beta-N-acetylhexosaminidase
MRVHTGVRAAGCVSAVLLAASCTSAPPAPVEHRADVAAVPAASGTSATGRFRPLPIANGWGPTPAEIAHARRLVGGLTLSQRAGEVIVASYSGTAAPVAMVRDLHLGGVIAFSGNVRSTAQIRSVNKTLQASVRTSGRTWPLLVGVDQEGGLVQRVTAGATGFPTFMTSGAAGDPDLTRRVYAASGAELVGLGFNVDFAPDADVTMGPADPAIGARSAGSSPVAVTTQVLAALEGFSSAGILPVVKHFPGHGSVTTDSHLGLPVQGASLKTLRGRDLVPFAAVLKAGTSSVMVGHLSVPAVDRRFPSSLSKRVVTGLLRQQMGFGGVSFTDSLVMRAVADRFGSAGAAVQALRAGQDVLLMPGSPRAARDGIVRAVRSGRLDQARLDQAATRVVALMLHQRAMKHAARPPGSSAALSEEYSARAATVVSGRCSGRLVGRAVRVRGPAAAVARFDAAARAAGITVRTKGKKAKRATQVVLVGPGQAVQGRPHVVVALDTPYVLGRSRARTAKIATYGETVGAMRALVAVLTGRATAPGHLPVHVPGVARTGC